MFFDPLKRRGRETGGERRGEWVEREWKGKGMRDGR
jgi:hypothetical protein